MPSVNASGQPVSYRQHGEGRPAVLLVHGAGGSSLHFEELLRLVGGHGRRTLALDLPGHGSSPPLRRPPAPAELLEVYRDVVAEAAESLGLGRFVLAGHSMGGAVAQHFALAYPDRLEALVLIATGARLKVAPSLLDTIRHRFDEYSGLMASLGYSPATPAQRAREWAVLGLQAPQQVVLADFMACASFDLRQRLAELRCPTLVISASDDLLTPPALQQQLADLIPRARLEPVARAGHFLTFERPAAVAEPVLRAAGVGA
jgi:pimeloyl-ACP methyl ester carboxylesterase